MINSVSKNTAPIALIIKRAYAAVGLNKISMLRV